MAKEISVKKVIRDERRPRPRCRGMGVVSSVESKDDMGPNDQEDRGQGELCRHPLRAPCDNHHHAYATICVDQRKAISIHTSPDLQQHGDKIFDPEVYRIFIECADTQTLVDGEDLRESSEPYSLRQHLEQECFGRRVSDRSLSCQARSSRTAAGLSRRRKVLSAQKELPPIGSSLELYPEDQTYEDPDETQESDREYKQIRLDDHSALEAFYALSFTQIQQIPCKLIAVKWIEFIEPGKRTRYPYNGRPRSRQTQADVRLVGVSDGELTKPPWWPKGVLYATPHHQGRIDRVMLLVHLLRYDYKSKKKITSCELKKVTDELSLTPKQKRRLDDIYRVRHEEERLADGALQPDDTVLVQVSTTKASKIRGPSKKREKRKTSDSTRARDGARRSRSGSGMKYTLPSRPQLKSFDLGSLASVTESPEQSQDRLCDNMVIGSQATSALAQCRGDQKRPFRSLSLSQYAPGPTTENGRPQNQHEDITSQDVYTETQSAIGAQNFEFVHGTPCPTIALREAEQVENRTRMNQSLWPSPWPCMEYNDYAPSSAVQVYLDRSQSSYPSVTSQYPQNVLPSQYEHSPVSNASTHMSGLWRQQPSHAPLPSLAAPPSPSYNIEADDPFSRLGAASLNQEQHEPELQAANSCNYQIGSNQFHTR